MNNKMIPSQLCALSALSLGLMGCLSSNNYDSINIKDNSAYSYGVKAVIPTGKERVDIVLEYQGTQGEGADNHDAESEYKNGGYEQVRPAVKTQNNFSIDAASAGVKWNLLDKRYLGMNMYFNVMQVSPEIEIDVPAYLTAAPTRVSVSQDTFLFAPKFELYVPVSKHLQITGSILGSGLLNEETTLSIASISLDYLINKNLTLGLGYKNWGYNSSGDREEAVLAKDRLHFSSKSEISLDASGIAGELAYRF